VLVLIDDAGDDLIARVAAVRRVSLGFAGPRTRESAHRLVWQ